MLLLPAGIGGSATACVARAVLHSLPGLVVFCSVRAQLSATAWAGKLHVLLAELL